eukprot:m.179865 g.179865  ORF g.179865 m.179865 type:complete len:366 (-) comp14937_c0_seq2:2949-4046(-)
MSSTHPHDAPTTVNPAEPAEGGGGSAPASPIGSPSVHRSSVPPPSATPSPQTPAHAVAPLSGPLTSPSGIHPAPTPADAAAALRQSQLDALMASVQKREAEARATELALQLRERDLTAREARAKDAERFARLEAAVGRLQQPPTRETRLIDDRFGTKDGQCPKFDGTPMSLEVWITNAYLATGTLQGSPNSPAVDASILLTNAIEPQIAAALLAPRLGDNGEPTPFGNVGELIATLRRVYPAPLAAFHEAKAYLGMTPTSKSPGSTPMAQLEATIATESRHATVLARHANSALLKALVAAGLPEAAVRAALAQVDVLPLAIRRAVLMSKIPPKVGTKLLTDAENPLGDAASWQKTLEALRRETQS